MQVRYEITPSDHLEMLKVRFGVRAKLGRTLLGVAGTVLGVLGYRLFGDMFWLLIVVVFAAVTVTWLFMPYIIHRRIYNRNPSLFEMRTVTFSEEGVKSEKSTRTVEIKWGSFEKFKETKNLFLTYQTKDVVGAVPKRAFADTESVTQFRNLLASKMRRDDDR